MTVTANTVVDLCASTNELARALGESGCPHGTWISARRQLSGRGRQGRKWESIEGNLFLSIVARIDDRTRWSWIPLAAALGTSRALKRLAPGLNVRIKWPNDLWIGTAKLCGILCEAVSNRSEAFIIIGIGLNCAGAPRLEGVETISLTEALGRSMVADEVRAEVVREVVEVLNSLVSDGPATLATEYEARAAFQRGTELTWGSGNTGHAVGLGPSGELRVRLPSGQEIPLFAEEVRLVRPI